jgi:hypothetical protein
VGLGSSCGAWKWREKRVAYGVESHEVLLSLK